MSLAKDIEKMKLTDAEKEFIQKKFYGPEDTSFRGMRISLWFPEKFGLKIVDLVGIPPHVGDIFSLHNVRCINNDSDRDFDKNVWQVKEVRYVVDMIPGNLKQELLSTGVSYRCEVMLEKYGVL